MSDSKDGIIVVLSSPSGAGKTTLVKKISSQNNFKISISHTTRKSRAHEINGKDYFFIAKDEFERLVKEDKFLEYAEVFNNYYGSSKEDVLETLHKGQNIIFDIDWQGTEQIIQKQLNYKLITFFILPPSRAELHSRLLKREFNNKLIVDERMEQFDKDLLKWKSYDYVVINDELEKCYNEIISTIEEFLKNGRKLIYDKNNIAKHIDYLIS